MKIVPIISKIAVMWIVHAILLFGIVGSVNWLGGWLFLAFYAAAMLITSGLLFPGQTGLAEERWAKKDNAKSWDMVLMPLVAIVFPLLAVAVGSLNARLNGVGNSFASQLSGVVAGVVSLGLLGAAMKTNRFFSTHVRIQSDRGHLVVDQGPYRFVRHPGYVAMLMYAATTPLLLASPWAAWPSLAMACLVVVRTALEDKVLQRELPGYPEYSQRVPYRLIPGIW